MEINLEQVKENVFDHVFFKLWGVMLPQSEFNKILESPHQICVVLDENDSSLEFYFSKLFTNEYLLYHSKFFIYKKTRANFSQRIFSLLFMDSKNLFNNVLLTEDILKGCRHALDTVRNKNDQYYYRSLFEILSSYLYGRGRRKSKSIKLLKCMSCWKSDVKAYFGYYGEFTDPTCICEFFNYAIKALACNQNNYLKTRIVFFISDIDYDFMSPQDVLDLISYYGSQQTELDIKFILTTKNELPDMYSRSWKFFLGARKNLDDKVYLKIVDKLSNKSQIFSLIDEVFKYFSNVYPELNEFYRNKKYKIMTKLVIKNVYDYYQGNIPILNLVHVITDYVGVVLTNKNIIKKDIDDLFI